MFAIDFKLINRFFFFTQESLHFRVPSVFPQEFVSAKVWRMLITVPVSNLLLFPALKAEQESLKMALMHAFIMINGSILNMSHGL